MANLSTPERARASSLLPVGKDQQTCFGFPVHNRILTLQEEGILHTELFFQKLPSNYMT